MEDIKLGDRVKVLGKNCTGEVAYVGETHFSTGTWIGIILDEPKGRHDGTVDRQSYFKCPRPHGVFARPCQIEKEVPESADCECKQRAKRIAYPNYLRSKLKVEKHVCGQKNGDILPETQSKDNTLEKEVTDQFWNSFKSKKCKEIKRLLAENQDLKTKLKSTEDTLQDTLQKHSELLEEVKSLRTELANKTKQVRVQKCHLKLLQLRQCKHYLSMGSSKGKHFSIGNMKGEKIADVDATLSEDEFDLESIKAFASMERVVELEEQNRIMIEGLVELRDFLKYQPVCSKNSKTQRGHKQESSKKIGSEHPYHRKPPVPLEEISFDLDSKAQLEEYRNMLHQMTKFTKLMKEKELQESKGIRPRSLLTNKDCEINLQEQSDMIKPLAYFVSGLPVDEGLRTAQESSQKSVEHVTSETRDQRGLILSPTGNNLLPRNELDSNNRSKLHPVKNHFDSETTNSVQELRQLMSTMSYDIEEFGKYQSYAKQGPHSEEMGDSPPNFIAIKSSPEIKIEMSSSVSCRAETDTV